MGALHVLSPPPPGGRCTCWDLVDGHEQQKPPRPGAVRCGRHSLAHSCFSEPVDSTCIFCWTRAPTTTLGLRPWPFKRAAKPGS